VPGEGTETINYSIGYEFGGYLAGLERGGAGIELQAVLKGMLDALSGAEPLVSEARRRAELDRLKAASREPPQPSMEARARGFVDDFAVLNARREGVVTLPSGVQYEVLKEGDGRKPGPSDTVAVQYEGKLTTGVVFDTTYEDGEPLRLAIEGIVVPGLREALLLMREGDQWRVVIPPRMGFGASGNNMLRKRDLIYEVELVSVGSAAGESETGQSAESPVPRTESSAGSPE